MYQDRPSHNAVFAAPKTAVAWTRKLGGRVNGGLAFDGDTLYVESFDHRVSALDATDGSMTWSTDVGGVVMTAPIVAEHTVVVGTGTNNVLSPLPNLVWGRPEGDAVIGLDAATGRELWRYQTAGEDMPSPALVRVGKESALIFANGDGHVRVIRLRDGHALWTRAVDGVSTMSSANLDRTGAYLIAGSGLKKYNPANGQTLWTAPFGNADCSPTLDGGRVFVEGSSMDLSNPGTIHGINDVAAVDARSGKLHWRWYSAMGLFTAQGSNEQGIAGMAADGALYQSIPATNQFIAFDAKTGKVRWQIATRGSVKMSAVEQNGKLYFGDTSADFYVVDARTGRVLDRQVYPEIFTASPPVIRGGTLYIADDTSVRAIPLTSL